MAARPPTAVARASEEKHNRLPRSPLADPAAMSQTWACSSADADRTVGLLKSSSQHDPTVVLLARSTPGYGGVVAAKGGRYDVGSAGAYDLYRRACESHRRHRAFEAEALYRAAIAGGFDAARFNLGILLRDLGRAREAEAMLTAAVSNDDPEVASRAAFAVAVLLDRGRGDPAAAHRFYRIAYERGTGGICEAAALALVLHYAAQRDRETVTRLLEWVAKRRYRRWGVEPSTEDAGLRFARFLSAVLMWPAAHGSARFNRRVRYRARLLRRRAALLGLRSAVRPTRTT